MSPLSLAGRYQGDPWAAYMMSNVFTFISASMTSLTVKMRTLSSSVLSRLASCVRILSYLDFSYEPSEFLGFLINSSAVIPGKEQKFSDYVSNYTAVTTITHFHPKLIFADHLISAVTNYCMLNITCKVNSDALWREAQQMQKIRSK